MPSMLSEWQQHQTWTAHSQQGMSQNQHVVKSMVKWRRTRRERTLLTAGESGAECRSQHSTPAAPRKYAARSAAPRFCCAPHASAL